MAQTTAKKSATTVATEVLEVAVPLTASQIISLAVANDMTAFMAEYAKAAPEVQAEVSAGLQKALTPAAPKKDLESEVKRVAELAGVSDHRCLKLVRSITIMEKANSKILAINCDRFEDSDKTRNDRHPFPFKAKSEKTAGNEAKVLADIEAFKPIALRACLAGLEILNPEVKPEA